MKTEFIDTLNEQKEKIQKLFDLLTNQNKKLNEKLSKEKTKLEENSSTIKSLVEEIQKLDEEIFQKNSLIKIEELKAKTCSDETTKSFETLLEKLKAEIDFYEEKNAFLREETNIEINFDREMAILRIKFLQNDQEIFFNLSDPNNVFCSYDESPNGLIEDAQKQIIKNLIEEFNNGSRQTKSTVKLVLMLRDLFE
ncbi:hypothetical protein BpHYR1_012059 [Brachionus plicatilis]|uniref:Kinetochore protein SPC25 n=1 Tax=Brachionus plicatilis TaxID=10195 RepID=A0A3M7SSD1_BRAPC|nr:hypothetical protein BpHYR1_012059 [Brachionus plicatilis]